ncbi:TRAP transporter large permease [Alphaproteobacteria bacterium]|jgi:tripartite ATP-independent transporter DctM subunit|nr:TRAP transporter large permease [Alphaproteobacteria bacterium]MDB2388045.1 TRAP transporter large permease [Alphaproteobacteria bacterium]MDB2584144.1 TRAP transporter large permease [Alphaproteobacteria bacterium]
MDKFTLGIIAFPILFLMMALRIPIGLSMLIVGCSGTILIAGWLPILSQVKTSAWHLFSNYSLSVIPLFLLMGNFAGKAGMSEALFKFTGACLGHRKGGVAMAAIGACAGFGAICGSSLATAATMGKVALPELRRLGYSGALSTGTLAAGGTLGILIPPSVILIIYSILTEQNIAKMFLAAFIPGILAALGYILAIALYVRFVKDSGPTNARIGWKERFSLFRNIWQIILIFIVMIGGIYLGWFTPTEGGAIGAGGAGIIAMLSKNFKLNDLIDVIESTAVTSAMIFLVLLGAEFFNSFIALTQLPNQLGEIALKNNLSPYLIVACILILYLFLGCLMDSLAMILLTIPVFFPLIMNLDFGMTAEETAIWFGILTLIVVEVGLITPPVGLNVFIINKMAGDVSISDTFKGVLPFLFSDIIRVVILFLFPGITLFLLKIF